MLKRVISYVQRRTPPALTYSKSWTHDKTSMGNETVEPTEIVRQVQFTGSANGKPLNVCVVKGPLVLEETDAIIYAGSSTIQTSVGKLFQIAVRGGEEFARRSHEIMEQRQGAPLNIGEVAAIPASGILKCKYILHAVGPTWVDGITHGEEELLLKTVVNALKMANQMQLESVSLPLLCTDELFGFPKYISARTLLKGIEQFNAMTMLGNGNHGSNFDNAQKQQQQQQSMKEMRGAAPNNNVSSSSERNEQYKPMNRYLTTIRIVEKGWVSLNVLNSEFDNRKYGSGFSSSSSYGSGSGEAKVVVEKS